MAAGLEVYDTTGALVFGTGTHIGTVLGILQVTFPTQSGNSSITHPRLSDGTPFAIVQSGSSFDATWYMNVEISISGNVINYSWQASDGFNMPPNFISSLRVHILYGIY